MGEQHKLNPWLATRTRTGAAYDAPYFERAALGVDIHGEANLVEKLLKQYCPKETPSVLDGGCGTGRMGIELARRGFDVLGVDLDEVMLSQAQAKAPQMSWLLTNLADISLEKRFDAVVLAGNVMIFVTPGEESAVIANLTTHLAPNGLLITAFELTRQPWPTLTIDAYEHLTTAVGLTTLNRWSTWDQDPWRIGDQYVVNLHQKVSTVK